MIIVRLSGGLGNQLFQYAAGRRLALTNDTELKLDLHSFVRDASRSYALGPFNIQASFASDSEVSRFQGRSRVRRLKYRTWRLIPHSGWQWVMQTNPGFLPHVLSLRGNVYLDGVWQSPSYFSDVASHIRRDLAFCDNPKGRNAELIKEVATVSSVALHVRRTDYVTNAAAHSVHGVCSLDYYSRAIDYMCAVVNNPKFYVFSDDSGWAAAHIRCTSPVEYVCHNSLAPHEDIRIMSHCFYHIIANSSFSWWGAWLSEHPQKLVCAPRQWFRSASYEITELIPKDWTLVDG